MARVLIVHDSETTRSELAQALSAEGFATADAGSSSEAVRVLWDGSFDAVLFSEQLPNISGTSLEEHIRNLTPEVVTLAITRDPPARIAKKLADILDGAVAA